VAALVREQWSQGRQLQLERAWTGWRWRLGRLRRLVLVEVLEWRLRLLGRELMVLSMLLLLQLGQVLAGNVRECR